ncbi:MAG: hypothetical protein GTO55_09300, partial [Armatimonadetes bacterium]|nr:hypothetical protein [Armatimonadota bacterium]NIM24443.1 hypothetical protein [Armatimonadota bacterium]NIM68314.1 hypothetical protein [Armatimonadota bacterium]NIM76718.1 hypothetical protein [Armatimonadota bacterium]NIN06517.1 hypothetical protein [Armatimonadota bacterium]
MNQDTAEETLPSRSWKWRHPLLFCGMAWLFSAQSAGIGIFAYIHLVRPFASGRIPGVSPMPPIVIGLAVGLLDVLWAKHLLQNRIEEEAQILAFPKRERSFRQKISQVLPYLQFPTITCAVGLILYFIMTSVIRPYVFVAPIVAGALFAPMPLQYPELLRRYRRAKEIATQSPEDADTYRSRAVEDIPAWPTVFSVFTIIAFLALGIWLQWGLPAAAQAEPDPYLTTTEPVGEAVQLTYNSDASSPAISPDGKLIAYVRDDMHNNYLETMSIDGRKKRRISTQVSAKY